MNHQETHDSLAERLALGLGWFSIALGVAEVAAPGAVARLIGAREDERTTNLLRAYGAREIANGVAILAQPNGAHWLWSRVAGDSLDLATLGAMARSEEADRGRATGAALAVLGVTALDILCATQLSAGRRGGSWLRRGPIHEAVTINRAIEDVEAAWHQQALEDEPMLVRFMRAPGARGTEMHVEVDGGSRGDVRERLRRFKQWVETGELTVSDGPSMWRPARPAASAEEAKHATGVTR